MISSTAKDLPDHREQVRLACERAGFAPQEMMEHLTAESDGATAVSLSMVERADIYICVLGYRYGHIPEGDGFSITEMEYNRAAELNKPVLLFLIDKDHLVTIEQVDTGANAAKLHAFKSRIIKNHVAAFFDSPKDLRGHVIAALTRLREKLDAHTADSKNSQFQEDLHRQSSIPIAPEPYVAHPYLLLQSRSLIGRRMEQNVLTEWISEPASARHARVFSLIAIGGMGKSALAWDWFNQIALTLPFAGRMWWSFYESDADFETFLIRALSYVSGEPEVLVRGLPWQEREARLLRYLNETAYLLVLDGLERILIAYNRNDRDDLTDEREATQLARATGLPLSITADLHRSRQTADPRAGAFLQKLASIRLSRILVTTRLFPKALELPNGNPRPGCAPYFLRGLSDFDALLLWRTLGVQGNNDEFVRIFHSIAGHPLLVQALASEVSNYRKAPGNFNKWREDHPQFNPAILPLVQSRTHILTFSLKGLSSLLSKVLLTIISFHMPASYASLEMLLVGPDRSCASASELDAALTELEDRALIGWDRAANRYDAHPIVRGVVWQNADHEEKRAILNALDAHFASMSTPDWQRVDTLSDLAPAIERFHILIELDRYDEAWDLYRNNMHMATIYRLSLPGETNKWVERLFAQGADSLPALTKVDQQCLALDEWAWSFFFAGKTDAAVEIIRRSRSLSKEKRVDILDANSSLPFTEAGLLRESMELAHEGLLRSRAQQDLHREGISLQHLGRLYTIIGDYKTSSACLHRSAGIFNKLGQAINESMTKTFLVDLALTLGETAKAKSLADEAFEAGAGFEMTAIYAALKLGELDCLVGELDRAEEYLSLTLGRARSAGFLWGEIPTLIALAKVGLRRGEVTKARAWLREAHDLIERGSYLLHGCDAWNVLAEIELGDGNISHGAAAATRAYQASWCDGPPYVYWRGFERAKACLGALSVPEPQLQGVEKSEAKEFPRAEINPPDEYWIDAGVY